jgi:uncharacterized protein
MIDPVSNIYIVFLIGFVASFFGALMGIGGGVFIVPALNLIFNLPIQVAIGSSLTTIIANSCTSSYNYVKNGLTNIRIAFLLCCTIVPGAITGSWLARYIPANVLTIIFCVIILAMSYWMIRKPSSPAAHEPCNKEINKAIDIISQDSYFDRNLNTRIDYRISRKRFGIISTFFSGIISSLLGVGGGIINVPVMTLVMGIPIKVAVATSSFMIMITAAAGATVYYYNGYIFPVLVAPLIIGAIAGSMAGAAVLQRTRPRHLQRVFAAVTVIISILMILRVFKVI